MADISQTDGTVDTSTTLNNTQDNTQTSSVQNSEGNEKLFTQAEIDEIVQKRLGRTKEQFADYDELKAFKEQAEAAKLTEAEKTAKRISELEKYESVAKTRGEVLEKLLSAQLENVPEDKLGLIPKDFSNEQKLNYLLENKQFFHTGKDIITPDDSKPKENNTIGAYGGKFQTLDEWAEADPVGYLRATRGSSGSLF